jgi:hypothetical protein
MIMTNDVVPTSIAPLSVDKQILLAIKKRYDLNPNQKELAFETGVLITKLDNENDYLELITSLEGLKEKAGLEYTIDNTYTDSRGRTQHHTLYGSRLCKIKIVDNDLFEQALGSLHENTATSVPEDDDIIKYGGLTYYLKSCELRYKNGKSTTVSPENREMKFFLCLYRNRGNVCHFKDIAKDVQTAEYKEMTSPDEDGARTTHEELTDNEFTDEVSGLKRDFRTLILSLGMPEKEFKKIIVRVPKLGFKLA